MNEWPIKTFPALNKDFFDYGIGAVFVREGNKGIYVIIPFYHIPSSVLFLSADIWGWDSKSLSLVPAGAGSCSIGSDKYHGHFIIKNGVLKQD